MGKLIHPRAENEDKRRRELILNILLLFSLACFFVINVIRLIDVIKDPHHGLPFVYTLLIMAFFVFLFWLNRKGAVKTAASLLIITYSLPMFYSFIVWGADLPAGLLLAVLMITLSGILLGANLALISTAVFIVFSLLLTYLQAHNLIAVDISWRAGQHELADAIAYAVLFMVIAAVAWLFSREIGRALKRARQSEEALKTERDLLEIKVEERTQQIRQMQAEKINQLYRLAEFGRLSSGIFHDLVNPLTAVSLNLEQIKSEGQNQISNAKSYLSQALLATRKMENLIASIKKQIARENEKKNFSVREEISQTLQILVYKARRAGVRLELKGPDARLYGDPIKFGQVITNLLANAIEACENNKKEKIVSVKMAINGSKLLLKVVDRGCGIAAADQSRVFEPFFSTKKEGGRGLGLGLASAKHIVEKDFQGKITLNSELGRGSEFNLSLPLKTA